MRTKQQERHAEEAAAIDTPRQQQHLGYAAHPIHSHVAQEPKREGSADVDAPVEPED